MGADAGIHIRIKGIDNEEPVNIPDIGTGDDFFFLLSEGLSHKLNFKLEEETFNQIKDYDFVEDKISPMLSGDPKEPDYRKPFEIRKIVNLIQSDILKKIKSGEIKIDEYTRLYLMNLFQVIGGILSVCNYAENIRQEIAIVHEWY
jgi:hypothetical protein